MKIRLCLESQYFSILVFELDKDTTYSLLFKNLV